MQSIFGGGVLNQNVKIYKENYVNLPGRFVEKIEHDIRFLLEADIKGLKKIYLIFGMCDESFSINCSAQIPEDIDRGWFMFFVTLYDQIYWVTGAALGGILGSLISFNTEGLDFVMTAMFVVIFLEQWLKERKHYTAVIGVLASVVCLLICGSDSFLIPTMVCILLLLTLFRKPIEKAGDMI